MDSRHVEMNVIGQLAGCAAAAAAAAVGASAASFSQQLMSNKTATPAAGPLDEIAWFESEIFKKNTHLAKWSVGEHISLIFGTKTVRLGACSPNWKCVFPGAMINAVVVKIEAEGNESGSRAKIFVQPRELLSDTPHPAGATSTLVLYSICPPDGSTFDIQLPESTACVIDAKECIASITGAHPTTLQLFVSNGKLQNDTLLCPLFTIAEKKEKAEKPTLFLVIEPLQVGDKVDVLDSAKIWCEAEIKTLDNDQGKMSVHYLHFSPKWDEELDIDSHRVAPHSSKTFVAKPDGTYTKLRPNQRVEAADTVGVLREAYIADIGTVRGEKQAKVHYKQWANKYDEWIPLPSTRLRPFGTNLTNAQLHRTNRLASGASRRQQREYIDERQQTAAT